MIRIKDVEHVAKLARLALTDDEKSKFARQLADILENFQQLRWLDTSGVEPLAHALPITNVLREDSAVPSPDRDILLKNAPDQENGYFKVPKIGE